jgi:LuxR family transcriptional regulator, maltose regulon positive regulatory protein
VAPAGYGKSALVAEWISTGHFADRSLVAVRLDPRDNDPVRFWDLVADAFAAVGAGLPADLADRMRDELRANPEEPPRAAVAALLEGIEEAPRRGALVLDDLHSITDTLIREGLRSLIAELPATVHLVLVSRASIIDLGLHRLRGRGALLEIDAHDLAFTAAEASALDDELHTRRARELPALLGRTEGWVTGLRFALQSGRGAARDIATFLGAEVLSGLQPRRRDFLLDVGVLDELSGPACDVVGEREDSLRELRALEDLGYFVSSLDPDRLRFRLQPALRELLLVLLAAEPPARQRGAHSRAATWYEQDGDLERAVDHALTAGEVERAAALILPLVAELHRRGRDVTLQQWFDRIPDPVIAARPVLALQRAWIVTYADDPAAALRWCEVADSPPDAGDHVLTESACLRTTCYRTLGDLESARAWGETAAARLAARDAAHRYEDSYGRLAMTDALAEVHGLRGEPERGLALLQADLDRTRDAANMFASVAMPGKMAALCMDLGRLDDASRHVDRARSEAARLGLTGRAPVAEAELTRGELLWERDDLLGSAEALHAAVDAASALRSVWIRSRALLGLARCRSAQHQFGEADLVLDTAAATYPWGTVPDFWAIRMADARLLLAVRRGDTERARTLLDELSARDAAPARLAYLGCVVALARGRPDEAGRLLAAVGAGPDHHRGRLGTALLRFRVALALSSVEAEGLLVRVLALGAEGRFVRTVIGPDPVAVLTGMTALRSDPGLPRDYLQSIENAARRSIGRTPRAGDGESRVAAGGQFTDGELDVIRFLPTDLSYAEIAAQRFVSVNTIKTQLSGIYRKLGVSTRAGAAERSRRLGLLP